MKYFFQSILILAVNVIHADSLNHLFIYIEDAKTEYESITYGKFHTQNELLVKSSSTLTYKQFSEQVDSILRSLPVEKRNVLFYIHGLWADTKSFYEPSGYILQKEIFEPASTPYGLVISLQWEGYINYKKDIPLTTEIGKFYAPIVSEIAYQLSCHNEQGHTSFICHSMGNRVFHSLIHELDENKSDIIVKNIFLCAADLPDNIFDDELLTTYTQRSKSTHVYYHLEDRTLSMAKTAVPGARLGISGPRNIPDIEQLKIHNVTDYDDFETFPGNISLHRYFYDSPKVRSEILTSLIE